ncbi:MAG: carbamoyl phosphate synthase small subunit [Bacillota bacterium]|jgi:carbamoyl-phosphate synthase small subunit
MKGWLVLEDGEVYAGRSSGVSRAIQGELVFNTAMTGYQEMLTDPSYTGQILVLCYPLTGNYGVNPFDNQSNRVAPSALVVREACTEPSHWQLSGTLGHYLRDRQTPYLEGVDTRALVRRLRRMGSMKGVIVFQEHAPDVERLSQEASGCHRADHVKEATTGVPYTLEGDGPHIVVLDLGLKASILRHLRLAGSRITVVPAFTRAREVLGLSPAGVLLSNGPGDPKDLPEIVHEVGHLIGRVPLLGVCLGNQILALALGADTYKMKFGHRGGNHPVKEGSTGRILITSQNHGYAVSEESLKGTGLKVLYRNLNDGTVEGLAHWRMPVVSVQFHPEGGPGPQDSSTIFKAFIERGSSALAG